MTPRRLVFVILLSSTLLIVQSSSILSQSEAQSMYDLCRSFFPSGVGTGSATPRTESFSTWKCPDVETVSTTACSWAYVVCNGNSVFRIDIQAANPPLRGTIPESIGNLKRLRYLSFFNSGLHGTIPESIGELKQLVYFELSNNQIRGTIPSSIGKLRALTRLHLNECPIDGSIPETFGDLQNLEELQLSNTRLSGGLPESMEGLNKITVLWLKGSDGLSRSCFPQAELKASLEEKNCGPPYGAGPPCLNCDLRKMSFCCGAEPPKSCSQAACVDCGDSCHPKLAPKLTLKQNKEGSRHSTTEERKEDL